MSADGGPAFPVPAAHVSGTDCYPQEGMSLRDYFAAKALQGLLASTDTEKNTSFEAYSKCAYRHADTMLKERAK